MRDDTPSHAPVMVLSIRLVRTRAPPPKTLTRADVTQILRDYAQDALLFAPDGPITGRHAIGEFYRGRLHSASPG
jgi:hypothetical protein